MSVRFNIALLQILPGKDQSQNLEKGLDSCRRAKQLGADLALFPEEWNTGFALCPFDEEGRRKWEAAAIDQQSFFFQEFVKAANLLDINIALTYLENYSPRPRNSVAIIDRNGQVVLNYSKVFICNFGAEELAKDPDYRNVGCDFNRSPGDTFEVCTLVGKEGEVKVGAMICADREFPEAATQLMLNGAELIVVPNACNPSEWRMAQLRTRAFDNMLGIAVANYPAPMNNGHSVAFHPVAWDPQGRSQNTLIVEAGEDECILLAEFDVDQIRLFRKMEQWRLDYRRHFKC